VERWRARRAHSGYRQSGGIDATNRLCRGAELAILFNKKPGIARLFGGRSL